MNATKKFKWLKVAETIDTVEWQDKNMCIVQSDGQKFTLAKQGDQLYAFAYKCPHAGGILADGCLDAIGNIVCPIHRYKFNIQNGRNTSGEGYFLKTYPVELREEGVFVGIEEKGFFNWR
jgi:3-phenylpropionate/trans-cinnamate dioxygenase ferredoxin subunit